MIQTGTIELHGRTWPTYSTPAFGVEVLGGPIHADRIGSAETVKTELDAVLAKYGLSARVYPTILVGMSPADRAERDRLDEEAGE